jgi:hypothetical protein
MVGDNEHGRKDAQCGHDEDRGGEDHGATRFIGGRSHVAARWRYDSGKSAVSKHLRVDNRLAYFLFPYVNCWSQRPTSGSFSARGLTNGPFGND